MHVLLKRKKGMHASLKRKKGTCAVLLPKLHDLQVNDRYLSSTWSSRPHSPHEISVSVASQKCTIPSIKLHDVAFFHFIMVEGKPVDCFLGKNAKQFWKQQHQQSKLLYLYNQYTNASVRWSNTFHKGGLPTNR